MTAWWRHHDLFTKLVAGGVLVGLLIAVLFTAMLSAESHRENEVRAEREASSALALAASVRAHVIDVETGLRGDGARRARWRSARVALPGELRRLRRLLDDDPPSQRATVALSSAVDRLFARDRVPADALRRRFQALDTAVLRQRHHRRTALDHAAAMSTRVASIALGSALLIVSGLVAFLLLTVAAPIRRITKAVSAIEGGDHGIRLHPKRHGDIGRLKRGVNALAESLADRDRFAGELAGKESIAREAQARTDASFEQAALGIAVGEVQVPFRRVNSQLSAITGLRREHLEAGGLEALVHADDSRQSVLPLQELWDAECQTIHQTIRCRHADGSVLWLEVHVSCTRDDSRAPLELLFQFQDVTDRHRAEAELRRTATALADSQEQLQHVLGAIDEVVFQVDAAGRWMLLSDAWERATGYPVATSLGRPHLDFVLEADRRRHQRSFAALLSGKVPSVVVHHRYTTSQGDVRWAEVEAHRTQDGGVGGILRDVTQRREAERAVRAEKESLAAVHEITRLLPAGGDVRGAICRASALLSGALFAILLEPSGDELVATAAYGWDEEDLRISIDRPSASASAFLEGEPFFAPDARLSATVDLAALAGARVGAVLAQPVIREDKTVAVLSLAWTDAMESLGDQRVSVLSLFAAQAGAAIERADLLARLEHTAHTDALTGLMNRGRWEQLIPAEFEQSRRSDAPLTVALLDLDHFKHLNDTQGHQAGDRLLRAAAAAWQSSVRTGDLLARWGGEEFVVAFPGAGLEEAAATVDRLRSVIPGTQTCSAGMAQWDGRESVSALIKRADTALYEAKESGRNRAVAAVS